MSACEMSDAFVDRQQSTHAANIAGGDGDRACRSFFNQACQQVDCEVVRPDRNQSVGESFPVA